MGRHYSAYTLFEMLITLTISLILLSAGFASYQFLIVNANAELFAQDVINYLESAKNLAQSRNERIRFCVADENNVCSPHGKYLLLSEVSDNQMIMRKKIPITGYIYSKIFSSANSFFIFSPNVSFVNNGTLWYCDDKNENPKWAIAVNKVGYIHTLRAKKDGHYEDVKGNRLGCK